MSHTDSYSKLPPGPQNAIDILKDQWTSRFPPTYLPHGPGSALLYEDERILWAIGQLEGIGGLDVLELGPFEAGHSYMLEKIGMARSVYGIEGNAGAFMKCLIAKEVCGLKRCSYSFGDFVPYLETTERRYDFVLASGVLYHMVDPLGLLRDIARVSERVYIWTHYYDEELVSRKPGLRKRFQRVSEAKIGDLTVRLHEQRYREDPGYVFYGGPEPISNWMEREQILAILKMLGFENITCGYELPNHENGPCFAVVATKKLGLSGKIRRLSKKVSGRISRKLTAELERL